MEMLRWPAEGPWSLRALLNKYPALNSEGKRTRCFYGIHRCMTGVGRHEIIVESPIHNTCLALLDTQLSHRPWLLFRRAARIRTRSPASSISFSSKITDLAQAHLSKHPMHKSWGCLWCRMTCATASRRPVAI